MTGRYQAYPEYKASPIDWLEKIPSQWKTTRLKYLGNAIIGLTYSPDEVVEKESKDATLVLRSSNVQNGKISLLDNVYVNKDIPEKLRTKKDDILICSRNGSRALIGKNARIDESSTNMTFGAFMTIFRSRYNEYLSHVFNSKLFEYQSGSFLTSTINQLTTGNLNSFEIPFPPEAELKPIINFLNHEISKIDKLISKQEKLIELLKEKRQAVISNAVTKGLNPDVETKDSGVEWLGKVPIHWRIVKLSYFLKLLSGDGITSNEIEPEGEYPVMGGNGLRGFTKNYNCAGEYALIGRQGALCGNINIATGKFFASEHAVVVYPLINFNLTFLSEFLRFMNLGQYSVSAAQPGISVERINRLKIAIPPQNEQKSIGDEIKAYAYKFDTLKTKAETMIKTLKERKTALISATVTGKIDVRNWQG